MPGETTGDFCVAERWQLKSTLFDPQYVLGACFSLGTFYVVDKEPGPNHYLRMG